MIDIRSEILVKGLYFVPHYKSYFMSDLIRVPTQDPELKRETTKKVSFFKELHRLLMNDTHLGQYMPILSETRQAKNVRMIND